MISESRRLQSMAKTNPKQFWENIKASKNNQKFDENNLIDIDSLHQYFTSLLGNEATPIPHDEIQPQINMDIDLDSEITLQKIKTAVYHQSNNKAQTIYLPS